MKRRVLAVLAALCFILALPVSSAPLFPDVPDGHWAKDAVAALAAKGLVEGYPDGTFKGDRAASRWEVAMIVARLLAKMEQAHATFATKAELEELRKLVSALREELDALGVRVTNLEENVGRLDQRVTELERITFYGYVDARVVSQSFTATGRDAMRSLNPGIAFNNINYNAAVGSAAAAGGALAPVSGAPPLGAIVPPGQGGVVPTFNPFTTGVLTATNWKTGRPLTNGTGFSMRGVLGLRIKVTDDLDAGAEFSAYASQGDNIIDAYYGLQQPYLSSQWTQSSVVGGSGTQPLNNQPFTRMTLDSFWVEHLPTKTKVIIGSFSETDFNPSIYAGLLNPNEFGPEHLPNFGFDVQGEFALDEDEEWILSWEAMGTALPDGNVGVLAPPGHTGAGLSYFSHAEGINVGLDFHDDRGHVDLEFLHVGNDANGGAPLATGLIQAPNLTLGWVNPNGFYFNQLGGPNLNTAGMGTTSDIRPIPGNNFFNNDGSLAAAVRAGLLPQGVPNVGGIGPQTQTSYGLSFDYEFDNEYRPTIYGEYAHSDYRPNRNSTYTADGDAFRLGGSASFLDGSLDVDLHYLSVDPRFSPFIIPIPTVAGISTALWHTPDFHYYNNLYSVHDTKELPHNREGVRAKIVWKFVPTGRATLEYGNLTQNKSSLQDVRYSTNALGAGIPNTPVLGYSPGFIEPLFGGYHPGTFAASGGNTLAVPLEDNKGTVQNLYFSAGHKWLFDEENSNRGVLLSGGFKSLDFKRNSNMQAILAGTAPGIGTQAENQNLVDLSFIGWHVGVDYDMTEDFTWKVGFTNVDIFGHLDPLGVTNAFAESTGQTRYNNVDITETWPDLGFEWEVVEDVTWGLEARYYVFKDNVSATSFVNPRLPNLNIDNGPQVGHPMDFEGVQVFSTFSVKF